MMGRLSFADAVYLLLMGELPSPAIGRMLNAVLVSTLDHGVTPPSTLAARNVATSGAPLKDCVAAGILAFGRITAATSSRACGFSTPGSTLVRGGALDCSEAAETLVDDCVQRRPDAARVSATGSTPAIRGRRGCFRWRWSSSSKASTSG